MPSSHRINIQAVILCGPGTSLYPFTSAVDLPKALLPIANKPMLQHPLEWCEKAGFDSILILTLVEHLVSIQSYIHSHICPVAIKVEAPSSLDESLGTADVLRLAYQHGWITGDFVVLPCDLVTNLNPQEMVEMWMADQAGFDANMSNRDRDLTAREDDGGRRGGLGVWYETKGVEGAVKGQEIDLLAVAPKAPTVSDRLPSEVPGLLNTLLFNLPGQVVKSDSKIPLRRSLLRKYPKYKILSTRRDSGIYFFPFWVLKFINKNKKINSIREDLLPWWSKCCWQNKRLAEKLGLIDILTGSKDAVADEWYDVGGMSTTRKRPIENWSIENDSRGPPKSSVEITEETGKIKKGAVVLPIGVPILESNTSSAVTPQAEITIPLITAYLPTPSAAFIRRVDTIQLYLFTSLYFAGPSVSSSHEPHVSTSINPKASVSRTDCLIAAKVSIAEKAVIKRSVLGHGVSIGKGARLLGCVLMDGASVAEGANLEGCLVGRHAVIGAGSKLKDCQVAEGFFVGEEIQAKDECFVAFSGLNHGPDVSGLGSDGACDMRDCTTDKNYKMSDWDRHSAAGVMDTTATSLGEQKKNEDAEMVEESEKDQKDDQDLIDMMMLRLEQTDNLPEWEEEFMSAASSADEEQTEHQVVSGERISLEGISPVLVPANTEALKGAPVVSAGMRRWWLPRLLLVWAVPVIGLGVWYGVAKYGSKIRFT